MPERIQQRRTKGWRKPENAVSVARPSRWGNPFRVVPVRPHGPFDVWFGDSFIAQASDRERAQQIAVDRFRAHLRVTNTDADDLAPLRGKNLMCFCPLGTPCHVDVLLPLANPTRAGVTA